MDMETGKYLAKSRPEQPGVANIENVSLIDDEAKVTNENVDFLLPMSTKFYDMRKSGQSSCAWNEEFILNELAQNICQPNVVILFEILECNQ